MLFLRLYGFVAPRSTHPVEASFQMPGRLHVTLRFLQSNYNQRTKRVTFRIKKAYSAWTDRQYII